MGTLNAFYVRAKTDASAVLAAIQPKFGRHPISNDTPFWEVCLPDDAFEVPEQDLIELSSQLDTDVIWLAFQSVVEAFKFHHWHAGQHVRSLIYGCYSEHTWDRVDGTPEPWEQDIFFAPDDLQRQLKAGSFDPIVNAREHARKIAAYYHFSGCFYGWDLDVNGSPPATVNSR